jgi:sigma-B regulation protein RsbU (phosphoserine phosphatase)
VTDIEGVLRVQVLRRTFSMLALGLALALVVNVLVPRLVDRPLRAVVDAVRRIRAGDLGARAPTASTRELSFLADEFNAMTDALAAAEEDRRQGMQRARRIQEHLSALASEVAGLSVLSIYEPADVVAGDYIDVREPVEDVVLFCVADVSGHGAPAALLTAVLKVLLEFASAAETEPSRMLAAINERFAGLTPDEDFASMMLVAVDLEAGLLRCASAGHEPAYLLRHGADTEVLAATGPILGVLEGPAWEDAVLRFSAGDRLVMLTDGVTELRSPSGVIFGRERLRSLLEENLALPLDALRARVLEELRQHRDGEAQQDDLTLVAVGF